MNSMQEALAGALEHPITEPRVRVRTHKSKKRMDRVHSASAVSDSVAWGILGSIMGCALIFGILKIKRR